MAYIKVTLEIEVPDSATSQDITEWVDVQYGECNSRCVQEVVMVSDKRLSELADEKMICKLSWEEEKSVAQELQKYRQMCRWIPVGERLPDDDTMCLGCDKDGIVWTVNFDDEYFVSDTGWEEQDITHWMLLPEPPV